MSQALAISAIDYCRSQKLPELNNSLLQQLPISSYQLPDGTHQIMSLYADDEWRLENARFPSNVMDSQKKLRFNTMPNCFVDAAKFAIKQYDIRNNPSGGQLVIIFKGLKLFFEYLERINITSTTQINALICANYVNHCKTTVSNRGTPMSKAQLTNRFLAVEKLYRYLKCTEYAFDSPWPGSSASHLAGNTGQRKIVGKTEIIDEKDMQTLVQYCYSIVQKADELITLKIEVERLSEEKSQVIKDASNISSYISKQLLKPKGYQGLSDFNEQYAEIFEAVAVIVMAFSGIRIHELGYIQLNEHGLSYRVEDNEDDVYYWLQSRSDKTGEGYTEWLVPEIVIEALEVQKRYVKPLQDALKREQKSLFSENKHHPRALNIENFKNSLFLSQSMKLGNQINPMTHQMIDVRLKKLAKKLGIKKLHAHMFRRTFAVYVAQSIYGDLRYLKQHFKHWGMDMTLSYASNDKASFEMLNDISLQVKNYKVSIIEDLLNEETIVAGGLANNIVTYRSRSESVNTFKTRAEMAEKVSDTIYLRSTGHSWCTSDNNGCGGRSAIESTACVDCDESIIEKSRHGAYFKGIYIQQLELRRIDDIGAAGKQRVERDIVRCEKVLKELGMWDEVKGFAA